MSGKHKRALVTGITGQDGSYLAELLIEKGYEVHGIVRRSSSLNTARIDHLYQAPQEERRLHLHFGDLTDPGSLERVLRLSRPDEVYNLGAQSHVRVSFDNPLYTVDSVVMGTQALLESIKNYAEDNKIDPPRFYQASSSEMFGKVMEVPQKETTPFYPRSPYSCGKVFSHFLTRNYRESYGIHASCGILFNHESPRRGETFVTRKITRAVGRIKLGLQEKLYLGNIDAQRDWGYAGDYVDAMWRMLQQDEPDEYVVATGKMISVREFADLCFQSLDLDAKDFIEIDARYFRPAEVEQLLGDPAKAKERLGWEPKTSVEELAKMMVEADLELAQREKVLLDAGHKI